MGMLENVKEGKGKRKRKRWRKSEEEGEKKIKVYILKIIDSREEIKKKAGKAKEKCICLSGIPGVFLVY